LGLTRVYLDHAAATPVTPAAGRAMADAIGRWANPSSAHAEGRAAKRALEDARAAVAQAYGWPGETLFTSGATEALTIALTRAARGRVLVSAVEHDAVMRAAGRAETAPVDDRGLVRLDALDAMLADGPPPQVAVQWCNSETGVIQPIAAVAERVRAAGGLLLLDAAQMPAGADPAAVAAADLVALSGHKRGGPPGIGALLVRDLSTLSPSGGQERGYRPGTENLPAAAGYAAALAEPEADRRDLRRGLDDAVRRSGGVVVGEGAPRHPAIGAYRMPGLAQTAQLIRLDLAGFAVSAGSACASGSLKPSHVLAAMGWPDEQGREVVRVSFGRTTTAAEVDAFVVAWRDAARQARRLVGHVAA